jgi:hypothetical protein
VVVEGVRRASVPSWEWEWELWGVAGAGVLVGVGGGSAGRAGCGAGFWFETHRLEHGASNRGFRRLVRLMEASGRGGSV